MRELLKLVIRKKDMDLSQENDVDCESFGFLQADLANNEIEGRSKGYGRGE